MNSKDKRLSLVYTSAKGIKFYSFTDPLQISAVRGVAAEKAKRFIDMNITERSLKAMIKEFKNMVANQQLVEAFSIIQEIDYRLQFICEENSILDLVCLFYFLEDEDPDVPSEIDNKEKHRIFTEDVQCKAFFLRIGLMLATKFSGKPEGDLLSYLEENQVMSARINRYIKLEHLLPLLTSLTPTSTG